MRPSPARPKTKFLSIPSYHEPRGSGGDYRPVGLRDIQSRDVPPLPQPLHPQGQEIGPAGAAGFLVPIGSLGNLLAGIDGAIRPMIHFRHGWG